MIDVHLIGYTADLEHLVLDLDGGAAGRYRLLVDADLFATLDELRDERRGAGLPVGDLSEFLDEDELAALQPEEPAPTAADGVLEELTSEDDLDDASYDEIAIWSDDDDRSDEAGDAVAQDDETDLLAEVEADRIEAEAQRVSDNVRLVSRPAPQIAPEISDDEISDDEISDDEVSGDEPSEDVAELDDEPEAEVAEPDPVPAPDPRDAFADAAQPSRRPTVDGDRPKLSPAQIQALLRSGKSPRSVAREAGTDVTWIERWLPPILAERTRILERAHAKRLERSRLGPSRDPLGAAVERNLKAKGLADEDINWEVGRRSDGRWKVTVKFTQRGKNRSATWTYDPADDELRSASETARDLGYTRAKRAGAKKSTAKKSTAKKSASKKSQKPSKKTAAKKTAAGSSPAKKSTAKKSTAKKSTAKKPTAKKPTAKKSTAKKPTATRATSESSSASASPVTATAKKTTAKKGTAKKTTAEKAAAKKPVAEKAAAKRSTAQRSSSTSGPAAGAKPVPQKARPVLPPELRGSDAGASGSGNGSRPGSTGGTAPTASSSSSRASADADR